MEAQFRNVPDGLWEQIAPLIPARRKTPCAAVRRFPTEKSLVTWREQAADGFTFTLKANQRITHFKRLADTDEDVRMFLDREVLAGIVYRLRIRTPRPP